MSKKQKTLFESWNKISSSPVPGSSNENTSLVNKNAIGSVQNSPAQNLFGNRSSTSPFQTPRTFKNPDVLADPEFDYEAGKTWIYPTNYPIRDYQFSIVQEALHKNTLVVLPTGLGKTFIAAVVMFNIYRWFPNGKVVFMAPTRPLVAQQVDACINITGIPEEDTTQMTGTNAPDLRKRLWLKKRVFFLTPQVLVNDLVRNICPPSTIKCLVVDEAHKALGNHAYCQVIKELCSYTSQFRVLALTATPGSDTQAVKQVLSNLLISHVEMRSEDSEDVQQYSHLRDIEKIVVPLGARINNLKSRFLDIINVYLKRLSLRRAMNVKNPGSLSKYQVLKLREAFSQHPPPNIDRFTYGLVMADFSLCISLYHAYELLLLHGAVSFYNFLSGILNGDKSIPHARSELMKNFEFQEVMQNVKETYIPDPVDQNSNMQSKKRKVLPGHPKLDKLLEVVLHHFERAQAENVTETRIMIFTQYRDSVQEIVDMLNQYQPMVKVMNFIGQSSKSATSVGYTQKQQLKVIQQFRTGGYNTLVSTCVGEEGLDIGEVDLIVCYDCPKSPIRLVQRMGRTGRLRKGRIIILIAEGKEEQMYNTCEYRKKRVHGAITKGFSFAQLNQNSPALIPPGVKPICVKTVVTIKPKKIVAKGVSKGPFLNDEEMVEFNQHVKVPETSEPLLPKKEFVILREQAESSDANSKSLLSLSDWTLWQTTPQRTDMIPHSSKSLLLVKILECIHFPELLSTKNIYNTADFADFLDKSMNVSKVPNTYSKSILKQSKITDVLSTSEIHKDDDFEVILSPDEDFSNTDVFKLDNSTENMPLLQKLFNINVPKIKKNSCDGLKVPPKNINIFSCEEFSCIDMKNFVAVENNISSIICVLNKKMKAKLKRKVKDLENGAFWRNTQSFINSENIDSTSKKLFKANEMDTISCELSADDLYNPVPKDRNPQSESQNSSKEMDGILFDIDFDLPEIFEDDVNFCNDSSHVADPLPQSHSKKIDAVIQDGEQNIKSPVSVIDKSLNIVVESDLLDRIKPSFETNSENQKNGVDFNIDFFSPVKEKSSSNQIIVNNIPSHSTDNISNVFKIPAPVKIDINTKYNTNNNAKEDATICHGQYHTESNSSTKDNVCNLDDTIILPCKQKAAMGNRISDCDSKLIKTYDVQSNSVINRSCEDDCDITTHSDIESPQNMFKKRKLSLNETSNTSDCNEPDTNIHSKMDPKSLLESKTPIPSGLPKTNDTTEIYKHSYFNEEIKYNNEECNFDFDISFDNNITNGDNFQSDVQGNAVSESTKLYSFAKDENPVDDLDELDKDAHNIIEQLFISQKDISSEVNTSFSSPLTLKRYISATDKDGNTPNRKKFCKESNKPFNFPSSINKSFNKENLNKSITVVTPTMKDHLNSTKLNSLDCNFDKIVNLADPSQYTLTQLLSMIDGTECIEKNSPQKSINSASKKESKNFDKKSITFNKPKICSTINNSLNNQQDSHATDGISDNIIFCSVNSNPKNQTKNPDIVGVSSDEEVCPTPPKDVVKPNSKFIYSKKSVKKSIDFDINSQILKSVGNKCNDLSSTEFKLTKATELQEIAGNIKYNDVVSEAIEKSRCDRDSVIAIENEEKVIELEPSPKITFDVSFDLPFTQEGFDSPKDQALDMNRAILVDSSSEGKLNNDSDSLRSLWGKDEENIDSLAEILSTKIDVPQKSIELESNDLSDEYAAESESLLPSKQVNENETFVLHSTSLSPRNIVSNNNPNPTYKRSTNLQSMSGHDSHNTINCKEKSENRNCPHLETCETETVRKNINSPLKNKMYDDFKSSIFFELLSEKGDPLPKNLSSLSADDKLDHDLTRENQGNMKNVTKILSYNDKNCDELKKTDHNWSSISFSSQSPVFSCESKSIEKNQKDCIPCENFQDSLSNPIIVFDNKPETEFQPKYSPKKVQKSNVNLDYHDSLSFSEDKLCFDLTFIDNDETCDILPKNKPDMAVSGCETFDKQNSFQKKSLSFDQNSLTFGECSLPESGAEDIKNVTKKSLFEKNKTNSPSSESKLNLDSALTELNPVNGDKNSVEKLSKGKNSTSLNNDTKAPVLKLVGSDSSDEFDFLNPNQITKFKKPNQVRSVSEINKHNNPTSDSSSTTEDDSRKKRHPCPSESKPPKLSSKNKSGAVLKGNAIIDDDEEDFLFIRKVHKKTGDLPKSRNKKRKQLSDRNEFLLSQADVSEPENSDCASNIDEDDDALEESFIDDESPDRYDHTDQHAFYLKSVKNCVGLPQQFKLKATTTRNISPSNEAEFSMYQHDSFCVSDDDVVFLSSDDGEVCSPQIEHRINKERPKNKSVKKKLKRVITHDSTSSSEHEISPKIRKTNETVSNLTDSKLLNNKSIIGGRKLKKKRIISSDEEDEITFIKPASVLPHCQPQKNILTDHSNNTHSTVPTSNLSNDKFEFSVNFGDDDFLSMADVEKIDDEISIISKNHSNKKDINNDQTYFGVNSKKIQSTSITRHVNLDSGTIVDKVIKKSRKNFSNKERNTQAASCSSTFDLCKKDGVETSLIKPSASLCKNTANRNAFSDPQASINFPSTSKGISHVETIDLEENVPNISFSIGWDEICPVSNVIEESLINAKNKNGCNSELVKETNSETPSTILVDSRELASGKPVISALRSKHKINPVVMQLQTVDYILSNRLAAERLFDSEFSSYQLPPKIVEKIKKIDGIYEKVVIIIEKDNRKNVLSFSKNVTKYLQFVVFLNCHPSIQVLFSKSTDQTSDLIASLILRERKKGFHIDVPVVLNDKNQKLYNFYCSFPKVSPICALNFMYNYPTVETFLKSTIKDLEKKGCITSHRALSIYNFIRSELTFHEKL